MTKEELIRNLKYTMEKHKNDNTPTFGTNISLMCKDVLDYLEQEPVLDKIKRDIFNACSDNYHMPVYKLDCDKIFEIIDKYKESEE